MTKINSKKLVKRVLFNDDSKIVRNGNQYDLYWDGDFAESFEVVNDKISDEGFELQVIFKDADEANQYFDKWNEKAGRWDEIIEWELL